MIRMLRLFNFLLLLLFFFADPVFMYGQGGTVDPAFNTIDNGHFSAGPDNTLYSISTLSNGKAVVGGDFINYGNLYSPGFMLLENDGAQSNLTGLGVNNRIRTFLETSGGKIYIGGDFNRVDGQDALSISKINSTGTKDAGFNTSSGPSGPVFCLGEQTDGKLIAGGSFNTVGGVSSKNLVRLNTDGTRDAGFNVGTGASSQVLTLKVLSTGKILIAGNFTSYNGTDINRIARLNSDGTIDAGFNPGTGFDNPVLSMVVGTDNKIYCTGFFSSYNGQPCLRAARLNADGSFDASFNTTNGGTGQPNVIALQADGKLIIGGAFTSWSSVTVGNLVRLNTDGSLDNNFNTALGAGVNGTVNSISVNAGGIHIAGNFTTVDRFPRKNIARITGTGALDIGYAKMLGASQNVHAIAVQADGKIVLGGDFLGINDQPSPYLGRMNADGSFDAGFTVTPGVLPRKVVGVGVQQTGKVIAAMPYSLSGPLQECVYRLNADGSTDNSFFTGSVNFSGSISNVLVAPDNKIWISGNFNTYTTTNDASSRSRLARLNEDGSIDAGFAMSPAPNDNVSVMALQPDGKVIIYGNFNNLHGLDKLVRIDASGNYDATFNIGNNVGSGIIYAIKVQPDGKILIGGNFTSFNGTAVQNFVRLNNDGSIDSDFNMGTGFGSSVAKIIIQSDGKIICFGTFSIYNGVNRNGVARLNTNGSLDASYSNTSGPAVVPTVLAFQGPSEDLIVAGSFLSINNLARTRVARILGGNGIIPVTLSTFNVNKVKDGALLKWTTVTESNADYFSVERSVDGRTFIEVGEVSAVGESNQVVSYQLMDTWGQNIFKISNLYYRLRMVDKDGSAKYSDIRNVQNASDKFEMVLLQNPVKDQVVLVVGNLSSQAQFVVYDQQGKIVRNVTNAAAVNGIVEVDVKGLSHGIYYLRCIVGSDSGTIRFLK